MSSRARRAASRRRTVAVTTVIAVVLAAAAAVVLLAPRADRAAGGPVSRNAPLVVFLGNSFTGGSPTDSGEDSRFPALVGTALAVNWMTLTADSAGYVTAGAFFQRFPDLATQIPVASAVVVILGSENDAGSSYHEIRSAAAATFARVHIQAPDAELLVVATAWGRLPVPPGILTSRNAVRDAAAQDGAAFVDPLAEGWWISGPDGRAGPDGLHASEVGHAKMAERLIPPIRELLARRAETS